MERLDLVDRSLNSAALAALSEVFPPSVERPGPPGPMIFIDLDQPAAPALSCTEIDVIQPMVDELLHAAVARFEVEAEAARAASDAIVSEALQKSAVLLAPRDGRSLLPRRIDSTAAGTISGAGGASRATATAPSADDLELPWLDAADLPGGLFDVADRLPADADLVFEQFWADATGDRPVIERLRRWTQREA